MKPKSSMQCSKEPATSPYFAPDESSPLLPNYLLLSILILYSNLNIGLPSGLVSSGSSTKI
jgi:hypothetical protein